MFSFINVNLQAKIKLLAVSVTSITALNLPSVIVDYTNALEVILRLGFTVAVGVFTIKKLKKDGSKK